MTDGPATDPETAWTFHGDEPLLARGPRSDGRVLARGPRSDGRVLLMTGFLVVRDDDTLRDRLAEALDAWRGIDPAHVDAAEVLLGVLREVGTPVSRRRGTASSWIESVQR